MGSKITRPDPGWVQGNTGVRRCYTMVLRERDNEVIHLVESDVISDINTRDAREIFDRLEKRYVELADKYPHPEYDIIQAQAKDLAELSGMFGAEDGFNGLDVERITSD